MIESEGGRGDLFLPHALGIRLNAHLWKQDEPAVVYQFGTKWAGNPTFSA